MNLGWESWLSSPGGSKKAAGGSWRQLVRAAQLSWSTLVSKLGERPAERPGLGLAQNDQFFIVHINV